MKSELIDQRQQKQKELLIEQLKKTPIIQVACEKIGVARATYYRWIQDDDDFRNSTNQALMDGRLLVNDLAESKLISAINGGELRAVQWWLRHNHESYSNKVEVTAKTASQLDSLTPEQEEIITRSISYVHSTIVSGQQVNVFPNSIKDAKPISTTPSGVIASN